MIATTLASALDELTNADPGRRLSAAQALADFQDPRSVPALLAACLDAEARVREAAGRALAALALPAGAPVAPTTVTALLDALSSDVAAVRRGAAAVLRACADEAALPRLLTALRNEPDPSVRVELVEAVGDVGHDRVLPDLRRLALEDVHLDVAVAAVLALGRVGHPGTVAVLAEVMACRDPRRRAAGVWALAEADCGEGWQILATVAADDADEAVRAAASWALETRPPEAPDDLTALLVDEAAGLLQALEVQAGTEAGSKGELVSVAATPSGDGLVRVTLSAIGAASVRLREAVEGWALLAVPQRGSSPDGRECIALGWFDDLGTVMMAVGSGPHRLHLLDPGRTLERRGLRLALATRVGARSRTSEAGRVLRSVGRDLELRFGLDRWERLQVEVAGTGPAPGATAARSGALSVAALAFTRGRELSTRVLLPVEPATGGPGTATLGSGSADLTLLDVRILRPSELAGTWAAAIRRSVAAASFERDRSAWRRLAADPAVPPGARAEIAAALGRG